LIQNVIRMYTRAIYEVYDQGTKSLPGKLVCDQGKWQKVFIKIEQTTVQKGATVNESIAKEYPQVSRGH